MMSACPKQIALLKEQVILVDKQDNVVGHETKVHHRTAHSTNHISI